MGWLHRLPYHTYQVVAQCLQICLVAQLGREGFQGLSSVVLTAVKDPVYEALYAAFDRNEEGRYGQGRGYDRKGGFLTSKDDEHSLQQHDAPEVDGH